MHIYIYIYFIHYILYVHISLSLSLYIYIYIYIYIHTYVITCFPAALGLQFVVLAFQIWGSGFGVQALGLRALIFNAGPGAGESSSLLPQSSRLPALFCLHHGMFPVVGIRRLGLCGAV